MKKAPQPLNRDAQTKHGSITQWRMKNNLMIPKREFMIYSHLRYPVIDKLMANWGLDCWEVMAYARIYDSGGPWQCFIYSINPEYPDECGCLYGAGNGLENEIISFGLLEAMYNYQGEGLQIDDEFRPRQVKQIYNHLTMRKP